MKNIAKIISVTFLAIVLSSCGGENKTEEHKSENMQMNNHEHQMGAAEDSKSELTREGLIDLASIDENADDKLYECPMDWNVLSDHNGDCPTCGMKLKEYTIVEVKQNLEKYGYEFKK
ncbi:MAG: hypothetical protein KDC88_12715 [Ignavibacteriae bacterium]|nr:hypothetical protein [Ignavibacteriota bacterium]MCB9208514.1 hypothetical protein [Ignavibacteriales bacterium]MCB9258377.1 hypothetical protein [Ignavibacteriales bacterium]